MHSLGLATLLTLSLCLVVPAMGDIFPLQPRPSPPLSDTDRIITEILVLKEAVNEAAKDQWEALQSLRFHLLSTRNGLKQAIEDIAVVREEMNSRYFNIFGTSTALPGAWDSEEEDEEEEQHSSPPPPAAASRCSWPGERVQGRCYVVMIDDLLTWDAARDQCSSLGGKLAGPEALSALRAHLSDRFGIGSSHEVRWSVWVGAHQQLSGWTWQNPTCSEDNVDEFAWADNQPHVSTIFDIVENCMTLDGFNDYRGVATPCSYLRRFVCDLA